MSRQSHLPPRCPFQAKSTFRPSQDPLYSSSSNDSFTPRHQKSISQSSILEEQPMWLDDLLNDTNENSKGISLRRSVSDPVTLLGGLVSDENSGSNESGSSLDLPCTYGPNSPKSRGKMDSSENIIVSKLTDYFSQKPSHYPDEGFIGSSTARPELIRAEVNVDTNAAKRHSGQRSRVRKLQYIAELERTVDVLQSLETELAIKVSSLLQQRVALSIENSKLKQQLVGLKQEKLFVDGEYKSLKKELGRLKNRLPYSADGNLSTDLKPRPVTEEFNSEAVWKMLEVGKINLDK